MSLVMVMALAGYSLLSYRINTGIPLSYKRVNVSGMTTMGSTASEMSEYEQGIVAQGGGMPMVLRRMSRRQSGSQVQAAREATLQWVR